jgi:hypothetical protein
LNRIRIKIRIRNPETHPFHAALRRTGLICRPAAGRLMYVKDEGRRKKIVTIVKRAKE